VAEENSRDSRKVQQGLDRREVVLTVDQVRGIVEQRQVPDHGYCALPHIFGGASEKRGVGHGVMTPPPERRGEIPQIQLRTSPDIEPMVGEQDSHGRIP
jgi:hypothetical protein